MGPSCPQNKVDESWRLKISKRHARAQRLNSGFMRIRGIHTNHLGRQMMLLPTNCVCFLGKASGKEAKTWLSRPFSLGPIRSCSRGNTCFCNRRDFPTPFAQSTEKWKANTLHRLWRPILFDCFGVGFGPLGTSLKEIAPKLKRHSPDHAPSGALLDSLIFQGQNHPPPPQVWLMFNGIGCQPHNNTPRKITSSLDSSFQTVCLFPIKTRLRWFVWFPIATLQWFLSKITSPFQFSRIRYIPCSFGVFALKLGLRTPTLSSGRLSVPTHRPDEGCPEPPKENRATDHPKPQPPSSREAPPRRSTAPPPRRQPQSGRGFLIVVPPPPRNLPVFQDSLVFAGFSPFLFGLWGKQ